jgi:hypothetical protein
VYLAIRDAVRSARVDAGFFGPFRLDSPATAERIRMACPDEITRRCSVFLCAVILARNALTRMNAVLSLEILLRTSPIYPLESLNQQICKFECVFCIYFALLHF